MTPNLGVHDALIEFARIVQGGNLPAQNPRGPNIKPIRVEIDISAEGDGDHVLFKSSEDTSGRKHKGQHRPEDFQQSRADRLGWIPHVLLSPDAVYQDSNTNKYIYVCATLQGEQFAVLIYKKELAKGIFYFATAYDLTTESWAKRRRQGLSLIYPVKSPQGVKGKRKKR